MTSIIIKIIIIIIKVIIVIIIIMIMITIMILILIITIKITIHSIFNFVLRRHPCYRKNLNATLPSPSPEKEVKIYSIKKTLRFYHTQTERH